MTRPRLAWVAFALCVLVFTAATGWLTRTVLRLQDAENRAAYDSAYEENVRLALWRADSALAALITTESARPYDVFVFGPDVPSPDADSDPLPTDIVRLRFQLTPDNALETRGDIPSGVEFDAVGTALNYATLAARIPGPPTPAANPFAGPMPGGTQRVAIEPQVQGKAAEIVAWNDRQQAMRGALEQQARSRAFGNLNREVLENSQTFAPSDVRIGPLTAVWTQDMLLLIRRLDEAGFVALQGAWLDRAVLDAWLRREIADLFPAATFVPVAGDDTNDHTRLLAALPLRLVPGDAAGLVQVPRTPLSGPLIIMWLAVALALTAVGLVLWQTLALTDRRTRFVSAVTHELRTPLTTFRLYTDMLAGGLVTDPEKERQYLTTLNAEASRLAHLIDNVLRFARLERGVRDAEPRIATLAEVWERCMPRLQERVAQCRLRLDTTPPSEDAAGVRVHADPAAVERILFNLVDNACKYAGAGATVTIATSVGERDVCMRVADDGPGIAADVRKRLFQPFHKSAHDAADTAPGVGLGLALSRRLARALRGELRLLNDAASGATFELKLRRAL